MRSIRTCNVKRKRRKARRIWFFARGYVGPGQRWSATGVIIRNRIKKHTQK